MLRNIRDFIAEQWFRFSVGLQLLSIVNFALLVIATSDKLRNAVPLTYTSELILLFVPAAFLFAWVAGYIMEGVVKLPQAREKAAIKRSPAWQEVFERLDRIEKKIK